MRKYAVPSTVLLVLFLLVIPSVGGAANPTPAPCPDFFFQNPVPQGDWTEIGAADSSTAWVVSFGGLMLKTSDAGGSWDYQWSQAQVAPDTPPLYSLSVVNKDVVWVSGDGGLVLVTTDGGASWAVRSVPQDIKVYGVSALDGNVAWVVGESSNVYRTTDGGQSWIPCPVGTPTDMLSVSALSDQNAWVAGGGNDIEVTTDGGASWNPVGPDPPESAINRIRAFDNNRVYAIGDSAGFFSTTNGGADWNRTPFAHRITLFDMSFIDTTTGWVSGTNDFGAGFVATTTDGGVQWTAQTPSSILSERNMPGISAAGGAVWASSVDGSTFRSTSGGSQWDRFGVTWTRNTLEAVSAIDARSAWVAGDNGAILRTFDGGESWVTQQSSTSEPLLSIDAVGSSTAWAVGMNGTIVKTTDYGSNWAAQSSGTAQDIPSVAAVDADHAWACAFDEKTATILRTTDGTTWTHLRTFNAALAQSVAAGDTQTAWFSIVDASGGSIYRTTDGGASWERAPVTSPFPHQTVSSIQGIRMVNPMLGYAIVTTVRGMDTWTYIFKTTDGGASWNSVNQMANTDIFGLATADGNSIWACGAIPVPYDEPTTVAGSADGGQTWVRGKNFHRTVLFNMDTPADGSAYWTVGYVGDIMRSTTPSVFSVSPDVGENTGVVHVALSGSGFWEGMTVQLVSGGTVVTATGVSVASPYEATGSLDLRGVAEGEYDVVTRNGNGMQSTLQDGFSVASPNTWYLPEGSTAVSAAGRFETWVLVENPGDGDAAVDVTHMTPTGTVVGPSFTMPRNSRQTINVADTVPNEASVSTKVASDSPIAVSRAMYWDAPGDYRQASAGSIGVNYLSSNWYMAEGSTGSEARGAFETWILVQNPGATEASVELTYLTPAGSIGGPNLVLGPCTRRTVNVADTVPNQWDVSTIIESDVPVAAERTTFWDAPGEYRQAAHGSIAAAHPASDWYMAEGSTGSDATGGFETWITIENPHDHVANARLYYESAAGEVQGPLLALAPLTRRTVNVADTVPNQWSVSTRVEADGPVVAERTTYWNSATFRQSDQDSVGALAPHTMWMLPEGSTGGDATGSFESWVLVQNPGSQAATVRVTYQTPGGQVDGPVLSLPAASRRSISIAETVPGQWSVSTMVASDRPVVADCTTYWNAASQFRRSAHATRGYAPY